MNHCHENCSTGGCEQTITLVLFKSPKMKPIGQEGTGWWATLSWFVGGHSCLIFLSNGQKNLDYHFLDGYGKGHWVAANAPYGHSKTTLKFYLQNGIICRLPSVSGSMSLLNFRFYDFTLNPGLWGKMVVWTLCVKYVILYFPWGLHSSNNLSGGLKTF